jgi:hypothetical protein
MGVPIGVSGATIGTIGTEATIGAEDGDVAGATIGASGKIGTATGVGAKIGKGT